MDNIIKDALNFAKELSENGLDVFEDEKKFNLELDEYASKLGYYNFIELLITNHKVEK